MTAVLDELTVNPHDPSGLHAAVDCVLAGDPSDWTDTALGAEIVGLRGSIDRLEAHFARVTWAAHQRGSAPPTVPPPPPDGYVAIPGCAKATPAPWSKPAQPPTRSPRPAPHGVMGRSARVQPARSSVPASTARRETAGRRTVARGDGPRGCDPPTPTSVRTLPVLRPSRRDRPPRP